MSRSSDERFSETLRLENRDVWDAMQQHRFVADVLADRLPPGVFKRYLVYEGAFVETAMAIFALALAKAPGLPQRLWLAGVVDALAREQIPYFEERFASLDVRPGSYQPFPDAVVAFRDGMLAFAEDGAYDDIVVSMLAAEWMYVTWCARPASGTISDPDLRAWVALHTEPAFAAQVEWLRAEADTTGRRASAEGRDRLIGVFRKTLELEIAFHSAPYDEGRG
ncbi:TenA family protein [Bauldia sp.]|uniref:TenA family protein n=1 Tax=Bauldia sp. TaxID=2575872 RepID=UPI003BAD9896